MTVNSSVAESEHLVRKKVEDDSGLHRAMALQAVSTSDDKTTTTEQQFELQHPSDPAADLEQQTGAEPRATTSTSTSWMRRCLPINVWLAAIATFILLFLGVFVVAGVVLGFLSIVIASWSYGIGKALKRFLGLFR
ncbi:hypothetical protein BDV11DRAFT_172428 [Aspergillus similis]